MGLVGLGSGLYLAVVPLHGLAFPGLRQGGGSSLLPGLGWGTGPSEPARYMEMPHLARERLMLPSPGQSASAPATR